MVRACGAAAEIGRTQVPLGREAFSLPAARVRPAARVQPWCRQVLPLRPAAAPAGARRRGGARVSGARGRRAAARRVRGALPRAVRVLDIFVSCTRSSRTLAEGCESKRAYTRRGSRSRRDTASGPHFATHACGTGASPVAYALATRFLGLPRVAAASADFLRFFFSTLHPCVCCCCARGWSVLCSDPLSSACTTCETERAPQWTRCCCNATSAVWRNLERIFRLRKRERRRSVAASGA